MLNQAKLITVGLLAWLLGVALKSNVLKTAGLTTLFIGISFGA